MYQKFELSQPVEGKVEIVEMPDGTQIHTILSGKGKTTVLLAHGYSYDHTAWSVVIQQLHQANYQTIIFDQRGHGQSTIGKNGISSASMASDYKHLIEHFQLEKCILVGHSMGGFLSMKFLIEHPEFYHQKVKSCVLVATFAGDINRKNFQNRLQIPLVRLRILSKLMRWEALKKQFAKSLLGTNPDPEIVRAVPEVIAQQKHIPLIPILKAFIQENYYKQLHQIQIPCAVLIGEKDATTPPFHSTMIAKHIPNTTKITVQEKGHCLNFEAPEEVVRAIQLMDI
jgi:pimeloyl-ACP methyl ester carboxylesterase